MGRSPSRCFRACYLVIPHKLKRRVSLRHKGQGFGDCGIKVHVRPTVTPIDVAVIWVGNAVFAVMVSHCRFMLYLVVLSSAVTTI